VSPQNVINQFSRIAQDPRVKYFGNVKIGQDVSVDELRRIYSLVSSHSLGAVLHSTPLLQHSSFRFSAIM
jgi:hypothetical protein